MQGTISKRSLVTLLLATCVALGAGYGLRAYADGAPTNKPLFYAGTIEANRVPSTGLHTVTLTLFDMAMGGSTLCTSESTKVPVEAGRFRVEVSPECVALMKSKPDLWVGLRFTGPDGVPHELPDRTKIGAVPYALEAQHAVSASSAGAAAGALADQLATLQQNVAEARSSIAAIAGSSAVSVANAAPVTVPNTTFVNLPFSAVEWDALNEYSAATGFTAKNAGFYQVCASVYWGVIIGCEIDVFIDGNRFRGMASANPGSTCGGCIDVKLNAGQRAQVSAYQNSGGAQTVGVNALWSYLNIHRIY